MTIGLALVLALFVFVAQEIISANLPGISKWLADLLGTRAKLFRNRTAIQRLNQ